MNANVNFINNDIDAVIRVLALKNSFRKHLDAEYPMVLVEGKTDVSFYNNYKNENVLFIPIGDIVINGNRTKTEEKRHLPNNKHIICNIVYGLSVIPAEVHCPDFAKVWNIYGIVDKDFEEDFGDFKMSTKLFQTDTHDLETLLMMTDEAVLTNIQDLELTDEEITKAEALAFELAAIRTGIAKFTTLRHNLLKEENGLVDYSNIVDGKDISIIKAVNLINNRSTSKYDKQYVNDIVGRIAEDNWQMVDSKNNFNLNTKGFNVWDHFDFWDNVNGHDLASALMYESEKAYEKYYNDYSTNLNRQFEYDLINAYSKVKFKSTTLFKKMNSQSLVEVG